MPTGILEVKLGSPLQMPERRLRKLLEQVRLDCCKARNAAMVHWFIWRKTHPDWEPGGEYQAPARRIKVKLKAPRPDGKTPKDSPVAPREFLSREMYAVATAAAANLGTSVASSCVQEVSARLRAKTPYNHEGDADFVWQAILGNEVSIPTWRGGRIPAPISVTSLEYDHDHCTLRFQLLSKKSGYKVMSPTVRLDAKDLSVGNRALLRRLVESQHLPKGTDKSQHVMLCDSQIVERKGKWYAQLCYSIPAQAEAFDTERVLTILPAQVDDSRPFVATWLTADGAEKRWSLGNGKPLVADYRRVVARRRALRDRYSDGCGSGHGRKRWYKTIKPLSRYVIDMQSRFIKQLVSDIIKLAVREQCGTILYRSPSSYIRDRSWFTPRERDVPMNWTQIEDRLRFKAEVSGLTLERREMRLDEWRAELQSVS